MIATDSQIKKSLPKSMVVIHVPPDASRQRFSY